MDTCLLRRDGVVVGLKPREQRLVAVLALTAHRPCSRGVVSGLLWPEVTEGRAAGSLRSAVFGLRQVAPRLLLSTGELLPGWYEDWVLAERERLQLLRLAGLENLAELLLDTGSTANHWPPPCWSPNWTRYGKARSGR